MPTPNLIDKAAKFLEGLDEFGLYTALVQDGIWLPKVSDYVKTDYWGSQGHRYIPNILYRILKVDELRGSTTGVVASLAPVQSKCNACLMPFQHDTMAALDLCWLVPAGFDDRRDWYFAMQQLIIDHYLHGDE